MLARITGHGEYRVHGNSIMSNAIPSFSTGAEGMRVCHREFISDVGGSVLFNNTSNPINPGLPNLFPWLSTIAAGFEEYKLHGLVFEYRPTSGTAVSSSSAALGTVIMATNYDVLDPAFISKQAMESYEYSSQTVPCSAVLHPVECASRTRPLEVQYVRTGAVPAGADARMYDIGTFQLATVGMQSAYTVGELWVTYDVSFHKPRISPLATAGDSNVLFWQSSGSGLGLASGVYLSTASATSTLPGIAFSSNSFLLPKSGTYLLSWGGSLSAGVITSSLGVALGANCTFSSKFLIGSGAATSSFSVFSSSGQTYSGVAEVSVTSDGTGAANTVTLSGLAGGTTGSMNFIITCLPYGG